MISLHQLLLSSVFFYVGPDEDVLSLMHMKEHETTAIYVEPLVAWRNKGRANNFKNDSRLFDMMFECEAATQREKEDPLPACVSTLTQEHVQDYYTRILRNLVDASECVTQHDGSDYNALSGLQILDSSISADAIRVEFVGNGVKRLLRIILKRIQDVTRSDIEIEDTQVSTFSYVGVGPSALPARQLICDKASPTMRVLTALDQDLPGAERSTVYHKAECPRKRMNIENPYHIRNSQVLVKEFCSK